MVWCKRESSSTNNNKGNVHNNICLFYIIFYIIGLASLHTHTAFVSFCKWKCILLNKKKIWMKLPTFICFFSSDTNIPTLIKRVDMWSGYFSTSCIFVLFKLKRGICKNKWKRGSCTNFFCSILCKYWARTKTNTDISFRTFQRKIWLYDGLCT